MKDLTWRTDVKEMNLISPQLLMYKTIKLSHEMFHGKWVSYLYL